MEERIPRRDFKVTDKAGEEIGVVTSGTFSPVLKRGIAMGYIRTPSPQLGETVEIIVRDAPSDGKIAKPPFYDDSLYGWKRKPHQQ
jgi:aminomethyltransferase